MNYIPITTATANYKEKRSEFIGFVKPIATAEQSTIFIKQLRKSHPSARHICWGYRLWKNDEIIEQSSDAGEPTGTAGIQIINELRQRDIVNCVVFIVRYFGGIKLGKLGLAKAYRETAKIVLSFCKIKSWIPREQLVITAPIDVYGNIFSLLAEFNGRIVENNSADELNLTVELQVADINSFNDNFISAAKGVGEIKKRSELDQTKEVRK